MTTATKNPDKPKIPARPRAAIQEVLDYNWHDEQRHYGECRMTQTPAELREDRHVFLALVKVANWLDGVDLSPDEYCRRDGVELDILKCADA
jgi:hypothetical protein